MPTEACTVNSLQSEMEMHRKDYLIFIGYVEEKDFGVYPDFDFPMPGVGSTGV